MKIGKIVAGSVTVIVAIEAFESYRHFPPEAHGYHIEDRLPTIPILALTRAGLAVTSASMSAASSARGSIEALFSAPGLAG